MLASFIRRSLFITTRILFVIQYFNLKLSISTTAYESPLKISHPPPQIAPPPLELQKIFSQI